MTKLKIEAIEVIEKWEYSNGIISGGVVKFSVDGKIYTSTLVSYPTGWTSNNMRKEGSTRSSSFKGEKKSAIINYILKSLGWKDNNENIIYNMKLEELKSKGAIVELALMDGDVVKGYITESQYSSLGEGYNITASLECNETHMHIVYIGLEDVEYILGGSYIAFYDASLARIEPLEETITVLEDVSQNVDFTPKEEEQKSALINSIPILKWEITPDKRNVPYILSCLTLARGGNKAVQFKALDLRFTVSEDGKRIILDKKASYDRYMEVYDRKFDGSINMLASYICTALDKAYENKS